MFLADTGTTGIPPELLAGYCAAAGAIFGGAVTGLFELCRDWFCGPRLSLDCKGTEPNRMRSNTQIYIRVRVQNKGRRPAKEAMAFLTSLRPVVDKVAQQSLLHDSLRLHWAGGIFTRDVPPCPRGTPGVPLYVDLVQFYTGKSEWEFCVEQFFTSYSHLKIFSGTYRLGVTITADNAMPKKCEVDVTFSGNVNAIQVEQVFYHRGGRRTESAQNPSDTPL
jgi:hypothetical protein